MQRLTSSFNTVNTPDLFPSTRHYPTLPYTHCVTATFFVCIYAFSCDGKYFASLGGQDDNSLVVWETITGRAVCGSPAAQDSALSVKWLHRRNDRFVTAGNFHLRVWQVDVSILKVSDPGHSLVPPNSLGDWPYASWLLLCVYLFGEIRNE